LFDSHVTIQINLLVLYILGSDFARTIRTSSGDSWDLLATVRAESLNPGGHKLSSMTF